MRELRPRERDQSKVTERSKRKNRIEDLGLQDPRADGGKQKEKR